MRLLNYVGMAHALKANRIHAIEGYIYVFLLIVYIGITLVPTVITSLPYNPPVLDLIDKSGTILFFAILLGGALYLNRGTKAFLTRLGAFNLIAFILTTLLFFGLTYILDLISNAGEREFLTIKDLIFKYSFYPLHLYIVFSGMSLVASNKKQN